MASSLIVNTISAGQKLARYIIDWVFRLSVNVMYSFLMEILHLLPPKMDHLYASLNLILSGGYSIWETDVKIVSESLIKYYPIFQVGS